MVEPARIRSVVLGKPMVLALLRGQTDVISVPVPKPPPPNFHLDGYAGSKGRELARFETSHGDPKPGMWHCHCPLGQPASPYNEATLLWVREAAYISRHDFSDPASMRADGNVIDSEGWPRIVGYAASMDWDAIRVAEDYGVKITPAIAMPRWASRLFLRVEDAVVERDPESSRWMWRVRVHRLEQRP